MGAGVVSGTRFKKLRDVYRHSAKCYLGPLGLNYGARGREDQSVGGDMDPVQREQMDCA